jgi:hypothetical protein
VTTHTLTLLLEDQDTGGAGYDLTELALTEAYVQQYQARLLEPWYTRCRDALLTARADGDEAIARAVKGVYTGYIGRMSSDFTRKGALRHRRRRPRPSNIIWLRNAHPDTYVQSLAETGVVEISIHNA